VDRTASASCPAVGFDSIGVETSGSATGKLVGIRKPTWHILKYYPRYFVGTVTRPL
jgi:hypothetical protein